VARNALIRTGADEIIPRNCFAERVGGISDIKRENIVADVEEPET
jgi:hypothetical protein